MKTICAVAMAAGIACHANAFVEDFSGLANGLEVGNSAADPSPFFDVSVFDQNDLGDPISGVIFDSDPTGPNAGTEDTDLLVDLGNLITAQEQDEDAQTVPGIFDTPDDEVGFTIIFDFAFEVLVQELAIVDINGGTATDITLTDSSGLTRTYLVPEMFTNDISVSGPFGFQVLDLTTLADQESIDKPGTFTTASEEVGFDASSVVQLEYFTRGSSAISSVTFVPTPGALALAGVAGVVASRRRRA